MGKKYIFMSQRDVIQMVEHGVQVAQGTRID